MALNSLLICHLQQIAVVFRLIFKFLQLFLVICWHWFTLIVELLFIFTLIVPQSGAFGSGFVHLSFRMVFLGKRVISWLFFCFERCYKFILFLLIDCSFLDSSFFLFRSIVLKTFERKFTRTCICRHLLARFWYYRVVSQLFAAVSDSLHNKFCAIFVMFRTEIT